MERRPSDTESKVSIVNATREARDMAEALKVTMPAKRAQLRRGYTMPVEIMKFEDEVEMVESRYGRRSTQAKIIRIIHRHSVQLALSIFLMADIVAVVVELFLEAQYPQCRIITRDAQSCCPAGPASSTFSRRLHGIHKACPEGAALSSVAVACDPHKWAVVHEVHEYCWYVTIAVLSTFLFEMLLLIYALRLHFFRKPMYLLDGMIIVGTLCLEGMTAEERDSFFDPMHFMILSRFWRFVRIGHGLVSEAHEHAEKELERVQKQSQELAEKLHELHELQRREYLGAEESPAQRVKAAFSVGSE